MNNRTLALLLGLLAVRVQSSAQVEVRASATIPAAPLPLSMAAPAALGAPAFLAPSASGAAPLAAPTPSASAPLPASAAPVAAADESAAIPAAALGAGPSGPEGPDGAAAAKAAGDAAFDGASAPTNAEIESLYAAARPGSPTIAALTREGETFSDVAAGMITKYTFIGEPFLELVRASPLQFLPGGQQTIRAAEELTAVADSKDPAARRFLQALGRRTALRYYEQDVLEEQMRRMNFFTLFGGGADRRHMPLNALGSGDYWDMAAGINAGHYILHELEPGTRYSFFDLSPFVTAYLGAIAARKGADAAAIEADILALKRPANPLAVLRTKNAVHYAPGFEKKLEEMSDWIAPGGRLVIQNDPKPGQRVLIADKHGALARRLIAEGWDFAFEFASSPSAAHAFDTLTFTRPAGAAVARPEAEVRNLWDAYIVEADKANAREKSFEGFLWLH